MTDYRIELPDGTVVEGPTANETCNMAKEMQGPQVDFEINYPNQEFHSAAKQAVDDLERRATRKNTAGGC